MSKTTNKSSTSADKRDFFRISHDVLFDYKVTDTFCAENDQPEDVFDDSASLGLINELRRLDRDNVQTLRLLTEKNRLLGDYLQMLSNKIDLIGRHTLFAHDAESNSKPTTRINLSEDGLAFHCDRMLYKDSYIAVRLVFLPSYSPVITFAKVLRCNQKEDKYQVAVKFFRLNDAQRQELSRQIMKAQIHNRKKARPKTQGET
ncbi:PilZ domain-containing protein [Agarilytica rhodophyticola]|uniref:PilZ domain-containing protein n=1 Tax=Agarilytica rhodophyticola TaxID=1737490 RepID=UPI000B3496B6|nr:PilZ domain-containing protein [Agarilytica rhodophyticola]